MKSQLASHRPASKLAAPIGVQDAAGNLTAASDGVADGVDGQLRGYPIRDRVTDDAVGEHVLDRAAVELALGGGAVLGDVGQPHPVRCVGAEDALHVVIEHRRASLLAFPAPAALRGREDPSLRAQLPCRPAAHPPPSPPRFVSEVSVAERRIVVMCVVQRVDPIRAEHVGIPDRGVAPPIVGLASELQNPARHRDGDAVRGELRYERVRHFGEPPSFRFACDRYAAARRRTSFSCSSNRTRFFNSRASAASAAV